MINLSWVRFSLLPGYLKTKHGVWRRVRYPVMFSLFQLMCWKKFIFNMVFLGIQAMWECFSSLAWSRLCHCYPPLPSITNNQILQTHLLHYLKSIPNINSHLLADPMDIPWVWVSIIISRPFSSFSWWHAIFQLEVQWSSFVSRQIRIPFCICFWQLSGNGKTKGECSIRSVRWLWMPREGGE